MTVVNMLLEQLDVNSDPPDEDGQTPVLGTAKEVHAGMVKMLQQRLDIHPNTADKDDKTAGLFRGANKEYEGVVNRLLERVDADPHTVDLDNDGQTYMVKYHSPRLTVRDMKEC